MRPWRRVVAFDYSANLIAAAHSRSEGYSIEYHVLDATDEDALLQPGEGTFSAAVLNMALVDMAVTETLGTGEAITTRHMIKLPGYKTLTCYEGLALADQPVPQLYFQRPLEWTMTAFFDAGFVLDGLREPVVLRLRKA